MNDLLETCLHHPFNELEPLFIEAFNQSRNHFSNEIHFYMPGMVHFDTSFYSAVDPLRFPAISVTENHCTLRCEHCKGRLLETMIPLTMPEQLLDICLKIKNAGGRGCLISGGSLSDGSVPLEPFIPYIKRVKNELGLHVVVHTGVVYPKLAEALGEAGIDAAMIDIIGSDQTIRSVYHLDLTSEAFDTSLSLLEQNHIPIVPHIVVGIHYGQLKGEEQAIRIVARHNPAAVVIVALNPLEKTPMELVPPPSPRDIARVTLASRLLLKDTPLLLGCARPLGEHKDETDILAIKAGVNGIAYPSEAGYNYAKKRGLKILFSEECCSLITTYLRQ
jgi:uncharacterized radical SAM superfamily protein